MTKIKIDKQKTDKVFLSVSLGGVKNSEHCEMGQNCGKNASESLKKHQNSINSTLNTTKSQWVPEKTEYDDYIVKQAKKLYKKSQPRRNQPAL